MTAHDVNADVLLPCPFCGEAPAYKVWDNHNYHRAACEACNLEFDFYPSRDELVAAWNRRTAHADLSGEVRELVEAATELRQRQRDYLSGPKHERSEEKGRLVGVAAARVDAALAKFTHQEKP